MSGSANAHECRFEHWKTLNQQGRSGRWTLWLCRTCGWIKLGETPTLEQAYPPEYYGSGSRKFISGVEWVSTLPPPCLKAGIRKIAKAARQEGRAPSVLDIGCGRGYLLAQLAAAGWRCAGLDIPQSPIPPRNPEIDFRVGSAEQPLPWHAGTFDLVVLNHVLEHTIDPHFVLHEASRTLRPGGWLYLGVPHFQSWQARWFGEFWFPLEIPRHLHHWGIRPVQILLEERGFKIRLVATRSFRQGVFGFIQSFLHYLDPRYPGLLLAVLQGRKCPGALRIFFHLLAGFCLLPLAFAESLISPFFGRGPVLVLFAQKKIASPASLVS